MARKEEIYEKLRYRIITNDLSPGLQLYEKELTQAYGIGRTPLREILQELQRNGLVEISPKLGTRVVSLDLRALREIIQVRRELESFAAELAVVHMEPENLERLKILLANAAEAPDDSPETLKTLSEIDIQFHQVIYESSRNRLLASMIESLLYRMSMYWFQAGFSAADFREQFAELEEFVVAIEERRPADAREIMRRHVDHFTSAVKEHLFP